jgi:hypothetical protein
MTVSIVDKLRLDYGPPVPWRRTRRARLLFGLPFILVLACAGLWSYPRVREQWQVLVWQERCMAAPVPPETVVLQDQFSNYPTDAGVPSAWANLYGAMSPPGLGGACTVFLQEMLTPSQRRRLVAVDIDRPRTRPLRNPYVLSLTARVIKPGFALVRPSLASTSYHSLTVTDSVWREYDSRQPFRALAGTRDRNDASHFTFSYESGGQTHIADGWLHEDDTVIIEPRPDAAPTPPPPASPASPRSSAGSATRP